MAAAQLVGLGPGGREVQAQDLGHDIYAVAGYPAGVAAEPLELGIVGGGAVPVGAVEGASNAAIPSARLCSSSVKIDVRGQPGEHTNNVRLPYLPGIMTRSPAGFDLAAGWD